MNIFAIDRNPVEAARAQHDQHVVKMVLETAQILCTVAHGLGVAVKYKPTHKHHPCTLWASETAANASWLYLHGLALAEEYARRFGRVHASHQVILDVGPHLLVLLPSGPLTPFAQAMPAEFQDPRDPVEAYRRYYRGAKLAKARYTRAERPAWAA